MTAQEALDAAIAAYKACIALEIAQLGMTAEDLRAQIEALSAQVRAQRV